MSTIEKVKDIIIYKDDQYNCFPNAIKKQNGDLLVGFRTAPDWQKRYGKVTHVDHASKAVYVTSKDDGETWDSTMTILYHDYFLGIQDPCINQLKDGTIFTTFFTWKVFSRDDLEENPEGFKMYDRWIGRTGGVYSIRSTDGGETWDEPIPIETEYQGIRGNAVELEDGTLLVPAYGNPNGSALYESAAVLLVTKDRGQTWEQRSIMAQEAHTAFHEPFIYRTESGKIVALLRTRYIECDDNAKRSPLYTCESTDNGYTWSSVVRHEVFSPSPFHAVRMKSGNVLLTYGYRVEPYGLRAMLVNAEMTDIDPAKEVVLREDGVSTDTGYTSSVVLDNGDALITYYYHDEIGSHRYIAGTIVREVE